jgi:hypothetical protein
VEYRIVLYVGVVADDDAIDVATQNGVIPDAGKIADSDVAYNDGALGKVNPLADHRFFSPVGFQLSDHVNHANRLKQERK